MTAVTITKAEIAELPIVSFNGDIHVINTVADAKKALKYLSGQQYIGFDTETRPSFKKGVTRTMALMQFATENECFLFRICNMGIPDILKDFLEDKTITKIGLSIKDDFGVLRRSTNNTSPDGFIELQSMVKEYGIHDISLQKIYAILFDMKISKGQRLSNWEAPELSPAQKEYAAIDAWACLKIYHHLKDGHFSAATSKYLRELPNPIIPTKENETI